MDTRPNNNSLTRLGITASRHYGIAVKRNRFKRVVREAFRHCRTLMNVGFDLNVKPRQTARNASPTDIRAELLKFLGKEPKVIKNENTPCVLCQVS